MDGKRKAEAALLRDAMKMKVTCHSSVASAMMISTAIQNDPDWAYAKGNVQEAKLTSAQDTLKELLTPWHKEFLYQTEFSELKKQYKGDRILVELTSFLLAKPAVEKLASVVSNLQQSHLSMMKA